MRKITFKCRAIQAVIIILSLIAIISIWPLRLWQTNYQEASGGTICAQSGDVNDSTDVIQIFKAQYDRIDSLDLYVTKLSAGRYLQFSIFDENMTLLYHSYVDMGETKIPGYVNIPLGLDLNVGENYTILAMGLYSTYTVAYEDMGQEVSPYYIASSYHDTGLDGYNIATRYNYSLPLSKSSSLIVMTVIILLCLAACLVTNGFFKRNPEKNKLITYGEAFRFTINSIAAVIFISLLACVFPLKVFDDRPANIILYAVGILITAFFAFYAINYKDNEPKNPPFWVTGPKSVSVKATVLVIAIALSIKFAVDYMNALYEIYHTIATGRIIICLLIVIIMTFSAKELFNTLNLCYLIVGIISGVCYRNLHLMAATEKEYDLHNTILSNNVVICVLAGLIIISFGRLIISHISNKNKAAGKAKMTLSLFGIIVILFAAGIVIFRNTRLWGIELVLVFGAFYIRYFFWEEKKRWLSILSGGLILNFVGSLIYCLLFRYFQGFTSARFSFTFHTVTVTAEYLSVMECVAAVMLLSALMRTPRGNGIKALFKAIWREFILFGFVSAYAIFTMSRTCYLAIGVSCIILMIVIIRQDKSGKRFGYFLRSIAVLIASVVICFPAAFTLQRTIPALVGHPYIFEIEDTDILLRSGNNPDCRQFMSIERFASMFEEKILGMDGFPYNYPEDKYNYDSDGNLKYGENGYPEGVGASADVMETASDDMVAYTKANDVYLSEDNPIEVSTYNDGSNLDELSNGRFTIFRSYLSEMNLTGHDEMGALLPNGEVAVHAHNTYIQVAYDHGVPVGILFVITILGALFAGLMYYIREKKANRSAGVILACVLAFAIAGISEWVFEFNNPMTIALMLSFAPIMFKERIKNEQ